MPACCVLRHSDSLRSTAMGVPGRNNQLVLAALPPDSGRASKTSAHACLCICTGLLACPCPSWACLRCTSAVCLRACCCLYQSIPSFACRWWLRVPCSATQMVVEEAACTPACCGGGRAVAAVVAARTGGAQVISCVVATIELVARMACPRALRPRQEPQPVGCTGCCCPAVRLLWSSRRKRKQRRAEAAPLLHTRRGQTCVCAQRGPERCRGWLGVAHDCRSQGMHMTACLAVLRFGSG